MINYLILPAKNLGWRAQFPIPKIKQGLEKKIQVKAPHGIDTTPINAQIEELIPIQIVLVDKTPLESLWIT